MDGLSYRPDVCIITPSFDSAPETRQTGSWFTTLEPSRSSKTLGRGEEQPYQRHNKLHRLPLIYDVIHQSSQRPTTHHTLFPATHGILIAHDRPCIEYPVTTPYYELPGAFRLSARFEQLGSRFGCTLTMNSEGPGKGMGSNRDRRCAFSFAQLSQSDRDIRATLES